MYCSGSGTHFIKDGKKMKRFIPFLLSVVICFVFFGCTRAEKEVSVEETTEETVTEPVFEKKITLGYYEDKSLNPYTTDSPANRSISTLIYDPLYILDSSYSPVGIIAESCEISGVTVTVKIKSGLTFSNGATLSSYDVAYSFNQAKESSFYSARLENISYATPLSDSVVFTLVQPDVYCEAVLTFPIVQSYTAESDTPVGSGRYTLSKTSEGTVLRANNNNSRGEDIATNTIYLTPISSKASELYLLQSGDLSYFFDDLSDSEYIKIGANIKQVPMNNLVFIGINSFSPAMSDSFVRQAVTTAINPKTVADAVFSGMCRYAPTPFNPDWYNCERLELQPPSVSLTRAQELLTQGGYVYAYDNNTYRSKDFEYLVVRLAVNKENSDKLQCAQYIHDTLEAIGIDVELNALPYSDYTEAIKSGEYDLYIGEVRLPANMSLSCFFNENGALSYGIDTESTVAASYKDFMAGTTDVSTFIQVFDTYKPFIPLCYRDGVAYFSREFTFEGEITEYEPFLNASTWRTVE